MPQVGDYVKCKGGFLKITKKAYKLMVPVDSSTGVFESLILE